jgi:hypothetical protein
MRSDRADDQRRLCRRPAAKTSPDRLIDHGGERNPVQHAQPGEHVPPVGVHPARPDVQPPGHHTVRQSLGHQVAWRRRRWSHRAVSRRGQLKGKVTGKPGTPLRPGRPGETARGQRQNCLICVPAASRLPRLSTAPEPALGAPDHRAGCPRSRHELVWWVEKLIVLYFESRELHSPTPITSLPVGLHAPGRSIHCLRTAWASWWPAARLVWASAEALAADATPALWHQTRRVGAGRRGVPNQGICAGTLGSTARSWLANLAAPPSPADNGRLEPGRAVPYGYPLFHTHVHPQL